MFIDESLNSVLFSPPFNKVRFDFLNVQVIFPFR